MTHIDLNTLYDELLQSRTYLSNPDVLSHVHWASEGHYDIVVLNSDQENGGHAPVPTVFSTIVHISDQSYWLSSDAGWKGPTEFTSSPSQAKMNCLGVRSNEDVRPFQADFVTVVDNTNTMQTLMGTPEAEVRIGFALNFNGLAPHLKFCHILFEVSLASFKQSVPTNRFDRN
jgi:hypothetical protein